MWERQITTEELLLGICAVAAVTLLVLIWTGQSGIIMNSLLNSIINLVNKITQKIYSASISLWGLTSNVTCLDKWKITTNFNRLWLDMAVETRRCEELVIKALLKQKYDDVYYWRAQKNALKMSQKVMQKTTLKYNKAIMNMKMQRDYISKSYADMLQEEGGATIENEFLKGQMSIANKFLNIIGEDENGMYGKKIKKKES